MNRRFVAVLVFALAISAAASGLVYFFVVSHVQTANRNVKSFKGLVASHELAVGAQIQAADLQTKEFTDAPPDTVLTKEQEALGRGVISTIYAGEPITSARLAAQGAGAGLAAMIPVGKRAVALRVNEVVGLAGFVVPGMRVDVIIAGNANSSADANGVLSRTVLQNIEVLSAGQKIEKRVDGKPQDAQVVNLLVTPNQAETLSLASTETKVQLVLRNPMDNKEEATHGTSVAALFGQSVLPAPVRVLRISAPARPSAPVVPKKEPEVATVEVFNGSKRSEQILPGRNQ